VSIRRRPCPERPATALDRTLRTSGPHCTVRHPALGGRHDRDPPTHPDRPWPDLAPGRSPATAAVHVHQRLRPPDRQPRRHWAARHRGRARPLGRSPDRRRTRPDEHRLRPRSTPSRGRTAVVAHGALGPGCLHRLGHVRLAARRGTGRCGKRPRPPADRSARSGTAVRPGRRPGLAPTPVTPQPSRRPVAQRHTALRLGHTGLGPAVGRRGTAASPPGQRRRAGHRLRR
jgi:hypothetical protein